MAADSNLTVRKTNEGKVTARTINWLEAQGMAANGQMRGAASMIRMGHMGETTGMIGGTPSHSQPKPRSVTPPAVLFFVFPLAFCSGW